VPPSPFYKVCSGLFHFDHSLVFSSTFLILSFFFIMRSSALFLLAVPSALFVEAIPTSKFQQRDADNFTGLYTLPVNSLDPQTRAAAIQTKRETFLYGPDVSFNFQCHYSRHNLIDDR
jgi:hypothetical protein